MNVLCNVCFYASVHQARLAGGAVEPSYFMPVFSSSIRPSICLFVRLLPTCEGSILKMVEPIFIQIGVSAPRGKGTKWSTLGVRKLKIKVSWRRVRFGGLSEASCLTPLGRVAFLVLQCVVLWCFIINAALPVCMIGCATHCTYM